MKLLFSLTQGKMKKRGLYIRGCETTHGASISTGSELFIKMGDILPSLDSDFVIDDIEKQLELLDWTIFILSNKLKDWSLPEIPNIYFAPKDQMYVNIEMYNKSYKLLQSGNKDGEIIFLNLLKELIKTCIIKRGKIEFIFFNKPSEVKNL